ncbi:TlpA family protein disulfide reductase [Mucilaginibacter sp. Bleaf8]|uniref:peroxiredoxin family protein n=1 Tax=Mucilaginibacter sp. Bleaf8 TaxID=2834430 RepID=UPI001BCB25EA|nr:TlpA disulfide reductase family protein [Mucilaginibacter sp. Bleaf8]MBS7565377.1 TlpA family protein disulfide reductase [Mucilaginibacter sp. Bleaf8]
MKNSLSGVLLIVIPISAYAQQTEQPKYKLPDGKIVRFDQLDSINKAWGGRGYLMKHDESDSGVTIISPMTDEFLRKQAEDKANLNALLNQPAPDFTLTDLTGKKWNLSALKGKTVVLNFWFTTCPACIQEVPQLNELTKNHQGSRVIFLGLGLDDAAVIKRFLKKHPFNYTVLQNADTAGKLYRVNSYPTSIVIDPKGVIRFIQVGRQNIRQQVSNAISQISNN